MVSFDVENLFTNVPLHETINIILDQLFPNDFSKVLGLTKDLFKNLLELSVLNSFFIFNNKLYKQIEGLGMGLPLGPTFANIFMCFKEQIWLSDCPIEFKPSFYKRYVDDTFMLFKDRSQAVKFLSYLNSKHPNIKFTFETEQNCKISFLDCLITRVNNSFETSVYRKDTFSELTTSFFSFTPFIYKINAMKTLIFRGYHISSNYINMHNEFEFLKNLFFKNGYPYKIISNQINKFLSKSHNSSQNSNDVDVVDQNKYFFSFPYFGPQSDKLKGADPSISVKIFSFQFFVEKGSLGDGSTCPKKLGG